MSKALADSSSMTKAQTATITKKQTRHSSLFAKCTAPFVSKQHSHVDQEILVDEPFRQYYPGDIVRGAIRLNVAKPLRITHLTLRLHGFVKVINRAKLPGEEIKYDEKLFVAGMGKGRRGIEYFGNGFAQLFDEEIVLCGAGCVSGKYEFKFDLALPSKGMPSSINVGQSIDLTCEFGWDLLIPPYSLSMVPYLTCCPLQ